MDQSLPVDSVGPMSSDPQAECLTKIVEKVKEINTNGITLSDKEILNNRLNFSWTLEDPDGKKGGTLWRNTRARRTYTAIQDADNHLFLVAILVIPPTTCTKTNFPNILNHLTSLESYEPFHLNLGLATKKYFESIAAEQGFASSHRYLGFLQALFPQVAGDVVPEVLKRKRFEPPNETRSEFATVSASKDPKFTTAQEQRVIENASLRGIAKVLNEHMCGTIRRVTVDGDLKAAVTMVFPVWGGPVDCLMSLDVCEQDVEKLAMALFKAKVKRTENVVHIVFNEGITLVIPNSEATLKGVPDVAIFKVFGPEIYDAITECPIRRRELAEEKRVTECVSMILTKNGAIINLSLGLERGLQIQNKLYT